MVYMDFERIMLILEQWGVADILLPFLLIFVIVFATLQKTKVLGVTKEKNPKKNLNIVVALIMGLAVVIPHATRSYPPEGDIVEIINSALPGISLVLVIILMAMLLIGIFGSKLDITRGPVGSGIAVIMILIVLGVFAAAAGWFTMPGWLSFLNNPETQTTIIIIIVFALLVWFITKEEPTEEQRRRREEREGLRELIRVDE